MAGELERNFTVLKEEASPAPYYLAYEVSETDAYLISATLGALKSNNHQQDRRLDVTVRVGAPELDNYHVIRGQRPRFTAGVTIALEDNENAIRQALWKETDRTYRLAAQRLIQVQTDQQVKVEETDAPPDFSAQKPETYSEPPQQLTFEPERWSDRLRKLSAVFQHYPGVLNSQISLALRAQTKYFINSEGSRIQHGTSIARLTINALSKAMDGMDLTTSESFEAVSAGGLPDDETILAAARRVAEEVTRLRDAPLVDPYVAPAILSGRAAGVFFHEIFGHRIEGHRLRDITEGQTFAKSLGSSVLPGFLSVISDPTRRRAGDTDLLGYYRYDDEGVAARPVPIVEKGIMKTFLMSRAPVPGIDKSNGHGRRQAGHEVVSRQSNLIVESEITFSEQELRAKLIDELNSRDKKYGFYFDQVTGGFTTTGRRGVQAFKVIPLVVYKVYADGRPDELVRGADIVGTPLAAFSKIIAAGDTPGIFNGYCGAESGNVPVSAVAPALLISEIEIQRKARSQQRPPLLPRPVVTGGAE